MTRTENYQLPQWEAGDPLRRGDFNEAMESIDTGLRNASYQVGSYTGNGATMEAGGQTVELGFRPRFLIIAKGWYLAVTSASMVIVTEHPNEGTENIVVFTDTGFKVASYTPTTGSALKINLDGNNYGYVAFQ